MFHVHLYLDPNATIVTLKKDYVYKEAKKIPLFLKEPTLKNEMRNL